MTSNQNQKESSRELTAQIRCAAGDVGRITEGLSTWRPTVDDPEVAQLRLALDGLVQNLAETITLLAKQQYEAAAVESQALKHVCDGVADLRPIGRLTAKLMGDGLRWKAAQKTSESA